MKSVWMFANSSGDFLKVLKRSTGSMAATATSAASTPAIASPRRAGRDRFSVGRGAKRTASAKSRSGQKAEEGDQQGRALALIGRRGRLQRPVDQLVAAEQDADHRRRAGGGAGDRAQRQAAASGERQEHERAGKRRRGASA